LSEGLPRGWTSARLGDLALEVRNGISAKPDGETGTAILRISAVRAMALSVADTRFLAGNASSWESYALQRDDLLFTRYNGNPSLVGVCARVKIQPDNLLVYPDKLIRVRLDPRVALPAFIEKAVHVGASRSFINGKTKTSAGQVGISGADLKEVPVLLPPLNEQRRIVAKVEVLQARSRRAREALDAVPPLLETLRQSILAAAFRGDLTKEWRAKHPSVVSADTAIARSPLEAHRQSGRAAAVNVRPGRCAISVGDPRTDAPPGWCWTSLLRVARMESGHTPSRAVEGYWGGRISWVSIPDARDHNGAIIEKTTSTITEEGLANSAARILPAETVCLVRTAASIGYVTILGREMATSQDFANWVCGRALLPKYLMYALWAERDAIRSFGEGSAHPTVYFPELKAFHLKLAPPAEQRIIVERIERHLATWERLRERFDRARQQHARLGPSYLAKAFRGELVSQDLNDEPAEAMLARVQRANGEKADKAKPGGVTTLSRGRTQAATDKSAKPASGETDERRGV
jgi:type I restriction enzyme, S subunit